ncbi:patatin-like phospholipase family protein [Nevskia sp.]|uniref:patatin-like phospholipase family protein n=1 Tax=Nevskia sp. TaxID=1929292 RepID=UPI0025CC8E08|nr:patatin-like phospholipase family protein [Nevskia sp.]
MIDAQRSAPEDRPSYPAGLAKAEFEALSQRRQAADLPAPNADTPTTGVAVSGGGIRSAIFALGVFQALAARDKLRHVDYLSTVSGGSYFGSFLGAMFARGHRHDAVSRFLNRGGDSHVPTSPGSPASDGRPPAIHPLNWLRVNGRFLAPRGGTDGFRIFALLLRNWLGLLFVVGVTLLTAMLGLRLLIEIAADALPSLHPWFLSDALSGPICIGTAKLQISDAAVLLPIPAAVAVLGGIAYWFVGLVGPPSTLHREWRAQQTSVLSGGLAATVLLLAWCVIDTIARSLGQIGLTAGVVNAVIASSAVVGLRKLLTVPPVSKALEGVWRSSRLPLRLTLWPVALLLWGLLLVALDHLAIALVPNRNASWGVLAWLLAQQAVLAFASLFLNRSSQHAFYAERLIRTFVGASNPQRHPSARSSSRGDEANVAEPIEGDDIAFEDYHGQVIAHGGPLHLINVTLNETVSEFAATMLRDRKGLPLVIGPCGLSSGVLHHALDALPDRRLADCGHWALRPAHLEEGQTPRSFVMFGHAPFKAEALSLGSWTAISGAAVATGLGSYGGTALSLLTGLANLRLGYWWGAGTVGRPGAAGGEPARPLRGKRPMQAYLYAEMTGRFWGPHRQRWYLSDGGHSENTGALELIRRRLDEIIVIDAEGDPSAPTGNLGELVRKARQDYGAEIEFERGASAPFGDYDALKPGADGLGEACAVRGVVRYPGTDRVSRLLYIRPVLSADDPPDLIRYRADNPSFPYQSTTDQFFDEAQWESYRKLGESIGLRVFR